MFLNLGSLHESEIQRTRENQVTGHKAKLKARKSLQKGDSLLAQDTLQRVKEQAQDKTALKLKRAKRALIIEMNKLKKAHKDAGIQARKDERAQLVFIRHAQANNQLIPNALLLPIQDPKKNPTSKELEALIANPSFGQAVQTAQSI